MNAQERLGQFLNSRTWQHIEKTIKRKIGWVVNNKGKIVSRLERDTEFCQMIKHSPQAKLECEKLLSSSFEKVNSNRMKPVVDKCPHGFLFYLCPILLKKDLIGILGGCEIRGNHVEGEEDTFSQLARKFELDEKKFLSALGKVKPVSKEALETEVELLAMAANSSLFLLDQLSEAEANLATQSKRRRLEAKSRELSTQADKIEEIKQESKLVRKKTKKLLLKLESEEANADDLAELKVDLEKLKAEIDALGEEAKRLRELAKELEEEATLLGAESKEAIELKARIEELRAQAAAAEERANELAGQVAKAENIIARSEEVTELKAQRDELDTLYTLTKHLAAISVPEEILNLTLDRVQPVFNYHLGAYIITIEGKISGKIKTLAGSGCVEDLKTRMKENWLRLQTADEENIEPFTVEVDQADQVREGEIQSVLSAPLIDRGEITGFISISSLEKEAFSPGQKRLFSVISSHVSIALARANQLRKSKEAVEHDELTGLLSFRYFNKLLANQFAQTKRYNHSLSLILIDFDHLEAFNEQFGYETGNRFLKSVAKRIKDTIREVDSVARFGGDQFIIILPETNKKLCTRIADRIKDQISNHQIVIGERSIRITVSLGVATYPDVEVKEARELFMRANEALYQAKQSGGNQVFIYGEKGGWFNFLKKAVGK